MDSKETNAASGPRGDAAACGPSPGPGCSALNFCKGEVSGILKLALGGWHKEFRTEDGFVQWGLVEAAIMTAIESHWPLQASTPQKTPPLSWACGCGWINPLDNAECVNCRALQPNTSGQPRLAQKGNHEE